MSDYGHLGVEPAPGSVARVAASDDHETGHYDHTYEHAADELYTTIRREAFAFRVRRNQAVSTGG